MSAKELKEFKTSNYAVANILERKEYEPFDDKKYVLLVQSAHDKQYYSKKSVDINFKHYRG